MKSANSAFTTPPHCSRRVKAAGLSATHTSFSTQGGDPSCAPRDTLLSNCTLAAPGADFNIKQRLTHTLQKADVEVRQ